MTVRIETVVLATAFIAIVAGTAFGQTTQPVREPGWWLKFGPNEYMRNHDSVVKHSQDPCGYAPGNAEAVHSNDCESAPVASDPPRPEPRPPEILELPENPFFDPPEEEPKDPYAGWD